VGGSETGAPPLNLGSKTFEGIEISTANFLGATAPATESKPAAESDDDEDEGDVHYRHNFTPSVARVGDRFIISSSTGLAEKLISALKDQKKAPATDSTMLLKVDGKALAALGDLNRERLVLQNMLSAGNDRPTAERNIGGLLSLLRYLGTGELKMKDTAESSRLSLEFKLGEP
jgi:hypothetical protein